MSGARVVGEQHTHRWQLTAHVDGCHFYESFYTCECGATRSSGSERTTEDPWSSIHWMMDPDCERCQDLLAGADPKSWDKVLPSEDSR